MIAIITLFSFIYTIPLFCEHTWEKDENGTIRTVQTPLRKEGPVKEVYYPVYRTWMNFFVRFVIPTISLIILNTLVIKEVIVCCCCCLFRYHKLVPYRLFFVRVIHYLSLNIKCQIFLSVFTFSIQTRSGVHAKLNTSFIS